MQTLTFDTPLVVGHRGYRARYPENTLASFEAAVAAGVDMVELDVHLSADNELIVIHDDTVDRTTSGTGPVGELTVADLKKLDAGGWFDSRFAGEPVPTLTEVLRALRGRVRINIEVKADDDIPRGPDRIARALLQRLAQENAASSVLISSFDAKIVRMVHRLDASLPVALIAGRGRGAETVRLCRDLGVYSFHPNFRFLTADLVTRLHTAGIRVFPYTVNTETDFNRMRQYRVDGIITDDPVRYKNWSAQSAPTD